ncbi:serine/threonine-protein kinase [Nocardia bovistercoris]|uniref:non-specific serine/threonine protein kinase n=1 Tax=Nocardia bovistercoris TaxID=2785916 RepID=A0A931II21_9NOCA|nr:serine/threonine-protein kinase [Nocardia bovistercoris]MBH0780973.1 serine/threonine protein kinase [Nocardia bovistercoris]
MATGSRVGSRFGRYELRRLLGVGGMGEVYEAYDTSKSRTVALKLLDVGLARDPSYVERFRRESHSAARLQEPHVIPVHDWGEIDGVLFIDMRLVVGQDLKDHIRSRGPLPPEEAVSLLEQIASALDAAHEVGLVHRDVKPANILVTRGSFAYLVDFGIAYSDSDAQLTGTGSAVGSFAYMAPERFVDSDSKSDPTIDIYSLACVLYQSLTGEVPFPAESFPVAIHSHQMLPPPRPSAKVGGLGSFDEVVARGMAKDSRQRYRTAGELAAAARAAVSRVGHGVAANAGRVAPTLVRPAQPQPQLPPAPTRVAPGMEVSQPNPTWHSPLRTHPSAPLPLPPRNPPPRRGGQTTPILAGALGASVVVLVAVIVAWFLWENSRHDDSPVSAITTSVSSAVVVAPTSVVVTTRPTTPQVAPPPPAPTTSKESVPSLSGSVSGADDQGFIGGPRCNAANPAYTIGRTTGSRIVVCRTGVGRYYYKGVRNSDNLGIELDDPVPTGDGGFTVTNRKDGTQYVISPTGLTVVQNGRTVASETMIEFASR